jgi:hypothetical protein
MATMLLVVSVLCLVSTYVWRASAPIAAATGTTTAVAASFLTVPPTPLVLPVALATGLVAAFGLAATVGILHPPEPHRP